MLSLVTLKPTNQKKNDPEFSELWKDNCIYSWEVEQKENDWEAIFRSKEETYVLLDETHNIYDRAEFFWETAFKVNNKVKLLCFALCDRLISNTDYISPINFKHRLTFSDISLTCGEYGQLIDLFNGKYPKLKIKEEIKNFMWKELVGHIGLIKSTLSYLVDNLEHNENPSESAFYECLLSCHYIFFLMGQRCYSSIKQLQSEEMQMFIQIMHLILNSDKDFIEIGPINPNFELALELEKYGLFVKNEFSFRFPAPIIGKMLKMHLRNTFPKHFDFTITENDFDKFLDVALSHIYPTTTNAL